MPTSNDDAPSPVRLSAREKAVITDEAARDIISTEASLRVSKTSRLRQMRQEKEAQAEPAKSVKSKKK